MLFFSDLCLKQLACLSSNPYSPGLLEAWVESKAVSRILGWGGFENWGMGTSEAGMTESRVGP